MILYSNSHSYSNHILFQSYSIHIHSIQSDSIADSAPPRSSALRWPVLTSTTVSVPKGPHDPTWPEISSFGAMGPPPPPTPPLLLRYYYHVVFDSWRLLADCTEDYLSVLVHLQPDNSRTEQNNYSGVRYSRSSPNLLRFVCTSWTGSVAAPRDLGDDGITRISRSSDGHSHESVAHPQS